MRDTRRNRGTRPQKRNIGGIRKMDKLMKQLILNLMITIFGTGALLGIIATVGAIVQLAETYLVVRIIMIILAIYSLLKLATE